jgi:hypothetical protein
MAPDPVLLNRYRALLAQITAQAELVATSAWDDLHSYNRSDLPTFIAAVAPLLDGTKHAATSTAAAFYAIHLEIDPPSITADDVAVTARLRDPFTATWRAIRQGRPYLDAIGVGRSAASAVADNFITSTARSTGDVLAERTGLDLRWQRVAEPRACPWCRARDGQTYWSADDADFGHTRCHCNVVPTTDLSSTPRESATDRANRERLQAQARLRAQIRTAEARQEQAAIDQLTEPDPARRERLSQREQEWETRAEQLRERLARL